MLYCVNSMVYRPVSIAALLVATAQHSTLRHAQQENNEVRDDRAMSYLIAMGAGPLLTSRPSARANESALIESGLINCFSSSVFIFILTYFYKNYPSTTLK